MAVLLRAALTLLPRNRSADLPSGEAAASVTIRRDHLAAYDRVCGFPLTDTLPATYPHVLAFPLAMRLMTAADFPFPIVGLVHVANRIEVHQPLAVEELRFSVRAENLRPHHRGQQFDVVAVASAADRPVWTGVSTYLRLVSRGNVSRGDGRRDRAAPPQPTATWRVPPRVGAEYAAVSGDRNPIHTSRLGARLFGFPRPIAHGMWTAARCLAALEPRLPATFTVSVDFTRPIPLPARVDFAAVEVDRGWDFAVGSHLAGRVRSL